MGSKKKIIVFANPFGFGPTGAAIALIKQLTISLANDAEIIYGASSKCLEPLSAKLRYKIRIEKINERNPAEISKILVKYKRPLVIVCLNRVAITTAKNLELDAFFIDPLTWLWKRIPVDYLRANIYYAYDIFNAEQKIRGIANAKLIPPALGVLPKHKIKKENLTLIHIGGFTNPLVPGFSKEYLIMLAKAINDFAKRKQSTKGVITGGSEPLNFLKRYLRKNKNIFLGTLSRQEFLSTLNEASLFVTTPGLTATLEAFALGTFVAFLPPTNLSQWAQLKLFIKAKIAPIRVEWKDFYPIGCDLANLTEKDAILRLYEVIDALYNNHLLRAKFEQNIVRVLLVNKKSIATQNKFIQQVGISGAKIVIGDVRMYIGMGRNRECLIKKQL